MKKKKTCVIPRQKHLGFFLKVLNSNSMPLGITCAASDKSRAAGGCRRGHGCRLTCVPHPDSFPQAHNSLCCVVPDRNTCEAIPPKSHLRNTLLIQRNQAHFKIAVKKKKKNWPRNSGGEIVGDLWKQDGLEDTASTVRINKRKPNFFDIYFKHLYTQKKA